MIDVWFVQMAMSAGV